MKPTDILHRAKTLNGEWVEGYYYQTPFCDGFIIIEDLTYEIDPSTLCVWTTLTDKNGKKVFSGDIISLQGSRVAKGVVEYQQSDCAFMLIMDKGYGGYSKTPLHDWHWAGSQSFSHSIIEWLPIPREFS